MSLEQQMEDYDNHMHDMFMDWFNSDVIRGDFFKACNNLSDKIPQVIDMNTLELAFHWKEQPANNNDDTELPF